MALVRPLIEYCAPVWSPYTTTQINTIEMVQRRAARFVKGNYQWTASVTEMLRSLQWESLRSRREKLSLGLFDRFHMTCNFKLIANICKPNLRKQRRRDHSNPLIEMRARTDTYYWSFFLRAIRQWNSLPEDSLKLLEIQDNDDV